LHFVRDNCPFRAANDPNKAAVVTLRKDLVNRLP
jgi:hypothetical protein